MISSINRTLGVHNSSIMKEIIIIQSKAVLAEGVLLHVARLVAPGNTGWPTDILTEAGYEIKTCGSMQKLREKCPDGLSKDAVLVLGNKFADGEKTDEVLYMIGEKLLKRTVIYTADSTFKVKADDLGFDWFVEKPALPTAMDEMAKKIISLLNN